MRKINILILLFIISVILVLFSACNSEKDQPGETNDTTAEPFISETVIQPETEINAELNESGIINPIFSHKGGLYTDNISLELSVPENSSGVNAIRYTVNGDEPTKSSPKYEEPVLLLASRESVVVRAACFSRSGTILGNVITNTYIKNSDGRYINFIISISADDSYLNGSKGIITNPTMSGKEWERPAHIEIINTEGSRIINQDAGLRIFGGSSRVLEQKSFRIVARSTEYFNDIRYNGKGSFGYEFFKDRKAASGPDVKTPLAKYDRLVLRNGGNDSMQATAADPLRMSLLRDGIANNFAGKTAPAVTNQLSMLAVIFLNGRYYGILDLKEDINDDYIKNVYGIENKDSIAVLKSELDTTRHCSEHSNGGSCRFDDVWFFYEMDQGADSELDSFTALCRSAISATSANRASVYDEVASKIDLENFMQYAALNLFTCNTDWPHNNVRLWRYTGEYNSELPETDGRWRFTLRDMDFSFGRYQNLVLPEIYTLADTDTFTRALANYRTGTYKYEQNSGYYPDSLLLQGLLDFCLQNESFRLDFDVYCRSLVTQENVSLLKAEMQYYIDSIKTEIPRHLERWKGTIDGHYDYENWLAANAEMLAWADERPAYFISYLENALLYYQ
ncbi:MAG: CotH kinase family protein [Eubacteriales bacterium]